MAHKKHQVWMKLNGKMVELKSCLLYHNDTPMPGFSTHDAAECVGGGPGDGSTKFVIGDEITVGQHIYHYNPTTNTYQYKGVRK